MKFSELFTKTKKNATKADCPSAELLAKGAFIDQLSTGVYTFLPLGLRVYKKIEEIIRKEMNNVGGQEILMPAMQPKSNWEKTKRLSSFDVLYHITGGQTGEEAVLGPTHEEVVTPLATKFIFSYKDLPKYVYQIQDKFRDEVRSRSGLLRAKEFMMKDLYSFHANENDLNNYYKTIEKAYFNIFNRCGVGGNTVLTYSSGGAFSEFSHEFQVVCETGEDTIYLCKDCRVAINKEIYGKDSVCPVCQSKDLSPKKAIEVGNIFKLMEKFSKAFNLYYLNEKNQKKPVLMGCYGIGLGRLLATVVEVSHDEKGIIWPESISPFDVHLVSLGGVEKDAEKFYKKLKELGYDVLWDDRTIGAGAKLADSELLGVAKRIVVSPKTLAAQKVEYKKRTEDSAKSISLNDLPWKKDAK